MATHPSVRTNAAVIVRSAITSETCARWLDLVDMAYRRVAVAPTPDYVPESSSFRLRAVGSLAVIDVWSALGNDVRRHFVEALGPLPSIDSDQCWVRRQYPPTSAPPRHRPHSWHQDGALGFDFGHGDESAIPDDALLPMVTCWIALTPCGLDAPGLEIVTDRVDRMLSPRQLADGELEPRWPTSRRVRPVLDAGDALVFGGDVLHRTHVSAAMTRTRTSIELRCFRSDAIPSRILGDQFVRCPP